MNVRTVGMVLSALKHVTVSVLAIATVHAVNVSGDSPVRLAANRVQTIVQWRSVIRMERALPAKRDSLATSVTNRVQRLV